MPFKPIKPDKMVISVRIDRELVERVDALAAMTDLSRNEIICQSIQFAIDNAEKQ